jgi:hypothetical protein
MASWYQPWINRRSALAGSPADGVFADTGCDHEGRRGFDWSRHRGSSPPIAFAIQKLISPHIDARRARKVLTKAGYPNQRDRCRGGPARRSLHSRNDPSAPRRWMKPAFLRCWRLTASLNSSFDQTLMSATLRLALQERDGSRATEGLPHEQRDRKEMCGRADWPSG